MSKTKKIRPDAKERLALAKMQSFLKNCPNKKPVVHKTDV